MTKFQVGDKVAMRGILIVVEVLELGTCDDRDTPDGQPCGKETFRFTDPQTGESDWMHSAEFEKIQQ